MDDLIKPEYETLIFQFRGLKVMIDADLAVLYDVPTKRLKEQLKRNIRRFTDDFMFELTKNEKDELDTNCDRLIGRKLRPVGPVKAFYDKSTGFYRTGSFDAFISLTFRKSNQNYYWENACLCLLPLAFKRKRGIEKRDFETRCKTKSGFQGFIGENRCFASKSQYTHEASWV